MYIGERGGMEEQLMREAGVHFKGIWCGKWRRYFSWRNFVDFFKLPVGVMQAFVSLRRFKPSVVFCKGGYVSFPVAMGAWLNKIPVVVHESDVVPGLTVKLCARFAKAICVSFEESKCYFPTKKKVVITGNPVRKEIAMGKKEKALELTGFALDKPTVLIMGGSQGATVVNEMVWSMLEQLLAHYQVIHICGKGKLKSPEELKKLVPSSDMLHHYFSLEYAGEILKDLYALADILVSRAGAMSLAEIDGIGKPSILIPLSKKASRGDQIINAEVFAKTHLCRVIEEENLSSSVLLKALEELIKVAPSPDKNRHNKSSEDATAAIVTLLLSYAQKT